MSKKRMTNGEAVLLRQSPTDRYRDVIDFCHAVKADFGSAANAAKFAIESSRVYQDWKEGRKEELTGSRTRSPSGQFVADPEQNVALAR